MDLVFLLDFYHVNATRMGHRLRPDRCLSMPMDILENLLPESRGFLIWHFQLENLIRFFVAENSEATRLLKEINAGKSETHGLIGTYRLSSETSLLELITEKRVFCTTCRPNVHGALALVAHFEQ